MTAEQLKIIMNAHMAGQHDAGIDASNYEALAYYESLTITDVVVPKGTLCDGDTEFSKDGCTCSVGVCFKEGHN